MVSVVTVDFIFDWPKLSVFVMLLDLRAELQLHALAHLEILEQREIRASLVPARERISSHNLHGLNLLGLKLPTARERISSHNSSARPRPLWRSCCEKCNRP
jgi:hypothetical protein